MKHHKWFERTFELGLPSEAFPDIVERVRGTPGRLEERLQSLPVGLLVETHEGEWSIQEHVGHLLDLEPLWAGRLGDLLAGRDMLRPADLSNQATWDADHNRQSMGDLLRRFRYARSEIVERLEHLHLSELAMRAQHPRLLKPMTATDLFFFVAEHDDHHMARMTRIMAEIGTDFEGAEGDAIDEAKLRLALAAAGIAHREYEENALDGVRDEVWAGWYAAYVLGRMGDFTEPTWLAKLLRRVPVTNDWPREAAALIVRNLDQTRS